MHSYGEEFNKTEALFDGFDGRVRDFAKQCEGVDKLHRFVTELNTLLQDKVRTSAQAKAVVEVLRGQSWLGFMHQMRQNGNEAADALLYTKNMLIERYEAIAKSISANVGANDTYPKAKQHSSEPQVRKSY